jgi:hypothetical protein
MKTGSTIDRLDRAAAALSTAADALGQLWASDSSIQFTHHLEVAMGLIEEVLTKSDRLTDGDRERLGLKLGLRLLGLPDDCTNCAATIGECLDDHGGTGQPDLCPCGKGVSDCATEGCCEREGKGRYSPGGEWRM